MLVFLKRQRWATGHTWSPARPPPPSKSVSAPPTHPLASSAQPGRAATTRPSSVVEGGLREVEDDDRHHGRQCKMHNGGGKGGGVTWRLWRRRASEGCGTMASATAPFASLTNWQQSTLHHRPHLVLDPDRRCPPLYAPRERHILLDLWDPLARRWGRPVTEVEGSWSPDLPAGWHDRWRRRPAAVGCGGDGHRC